MRSEEIAEIARVAAAEVLARKDEILNKEYDIRYHDVNLLLLESPQSYACMLCQNRQLIETEDGKQICRLRLEMSEAESEE